MSVTELQALLGLYGGACMVILGVVWSTRDRSSSRKQSWWRIRLGLNPPSNWYVLLATLADVPGMSHASGGVVLVVGCVTNVYLGVPALAWVDVPTPAAYHCRHHAL